MVRPLSNTRGLLELPPPNLTDRMSVGECLPHPQGFFSISCRWSICKYFGEIFVGPPQIAHFLGKYSFGK